jgi:hypothetical protein
MLYRSRLFRYPPAWTSGFAGDSRFAHPYVSIEKPGKSVGRLKTETRSHCKGQADPYASSIDRLWSAYFNPAGTQGEQGVFAEGAGKVQADRDPS